jgi:hypothetical protein
MVRRNQMVCTNQVVCRNQVVRRNQMVRRNQVVCTNQVVCRNQVVRRPKAALGQFGLPNVIHCAGALGTSALGDEAELGSLVRWRIRFASA